VWDWSKATEKQVADLFNTCVSGLLYQFNILAHQIAKHIQ
jgi:hypothetical protein